jgi:putative flippase GtrA
MLEEQGSWLYRNVAHFGLAEGVSASSGVPKYTGWVTSEQDPPAPDRERVAVYERIVRTRLAKRVLSFPAIERILLPTRGDRSVHKFIRYTMVSGIAVVISQVTLVLCTGVFGLSAIVSNTVAAVVSTPASYELNRKWAWGKNGKSHLWKEIAPFWGFTLIGYLGSTGTVQLADTMTKSHGVHGLLRVLAIMGAQLFAYGLVWIVKFLVFNRIVFAAKAGGAEGSVGAEGVGQPAGNGASASVSGAVGAVGGNGGSAGHAQNGQNGSSSGEQLVPEPRH